MTLQELKEVKKDEIKFKNGIYDLAHSIVLIFHPEISEGSFVFKNHKEKVIVELNKNKDIIYN